MTARVSEPPLTALAGIGPEDDWRRIRLEGVWEKPELLLQNRTWKGRAGFDVLAVFRPAGESGSVLVNRGWVEPARKTPQTRAPPPEGAGGVVRFPARPGRFAAENDPAHNVWFHVAPEAMAAQLGRPLAPFYIQAVPADGAPDWPRARPPEPRFRNDHLQYALTWFALAVALAVIYLVWRRRRGTGPS